MDKNDSEIVIDILKACEESIQELKKIVVEKEIDHSINPVVYSGLMEDIDMAIEIVENNTNG